MRWLVGFISLWLFVLVLLVGLALHETEPPLLVEAVPPSETPTEWIS